MSKKVYVVGSSKGYARWINNYVLTDDVNEADIALFTGGEDINPSIYGREMDGTYGFNDHRDKFEIAEYQKIIDAKVPIVFGTCRGFQLLSALNGAILIQDTTNHWIGHTHPMSNGNEIYEITSLHHQMVYPWTMPKDKYQILFWSSPARSRYYRGITDEESYKMEREVELMTIKPNEHTTIIGIQGHPEMMPQSSPTVIMLNELLNKYLSND